MGLKRLTFWAVSYLTLALLVAAVTVPVSMSAYASRPDHALLHDYSSTCDEGCANRRTLMQGWMFNHVVYDTGKALIAMTALYAVAGGVLVVRRRRQKTRASSPR